MSKLRRPGSRDNVSIVLCGQAGQGIQTIEFLLTKILKLALYNVFATKEYMSRIRGGANSTEIRVSSKPVRAFANGIDILIALDRGALTHIQDRIAPQTVILADKSDAGYESQYPKCDLIYVPFTEIATQIGNKIYSNIVAVGTIAGLFDIDPGLVTNCIKRFFSAKSDHIIQRNTAAVRQGLRIGAELLESLKIRIEVDKDPAVADHILLSGTEAVALGAIAGGCNFLSAYPMSPSTSIMVFLAKHAEKFGIIVEQAEDEIAAMNMVIGAWYAGARAMASTSGGGFSLMTEALSLAGMVESPVVIHLAQRPGPATGLPTRTEQADLNLALYAGHGEFPRIIFAPGKLEDGFYLTQKAFNLADKYQLPVFILTDQYFIDSYYNTPAFDLSAVKNEKHIIRTDPDYNRYHLTENGISPRGIPGWGKGLVCLDSDEHDQAGHITEDLALRMHMVDKRLKKAVSIKTETIPPELTGPADYKNLVVCWGSTYNIVHEAVRNTSRDDLAFLHFKQLHPLHEATVDYLRKARKTIIVEGNATGQFAALIKLQTGIDIENRILKYNGLNFSVEELTESLKSLLDKE